MKTIIKILITLTISLISKINNVQEHNGSWKGTLNDQRTEAEMIYNQAEQNTSLNPIKNCEK
ncbi:hypothetical protein [uncultured Aquimarina sp.]|uniref:hypothetical protein n=1 Tax=uncultured Aquimarina sp. TaxID=575652 RepID=UPI0026332811|nr:hypothetical protein [uncultured Aquimarina sp.]